MTEKKKMSEKDRAHMYFKRMKAGMDLTRYEFDLVKKYYPFMR